MSERRWELETPEGFQKVALPGLKPWVSALRSGEYPQVKNALCVNGAYCCLGLLSKLQGRLCEHPAHGWCDGDPEELWSGCLATDNPVIEVIGQRGGLPEGVLVRLGDASVLELAAGNDAGLTFAEIADILEEVYLDPAAPAETEVAG